MFKDIYIETDNLILRPFLISDAKDVAYYSQQPKVSYWMSDMVLHNESEAISWIYWLNEKYNTKEPFIVLAIEHKVEHKCIGVVGVHAKAVIEKLGFEFVDTKVIPYDSQMCEFDYYKLYNSNV